MNIIIKRGGKLAGQCIIKDESVTAEELSMQLIPDADMPRRPTASAGFGKEWKLDYVDDALVWVAIDRPLDQFERIAKVEEELQAAKILLGVAGSE